MLPEPYSTVLFLIIVPVLLQIIKLYRDKTGNPLPRLAKQVISFVLASAFVFVSGGFAGLNLPAFPVFSGDVVGFIGALVGYATALVPVLGTAFGAIEALYQVVFSRLFPSVGLA